MIDIVTEGVIELIGNTVAGTMTDQRLEAQTLFLGLAQEQRDVRVIACVQNDIRALALELGHQ